MQLNKYVFQYKFGYFLTQLYLNFRCQKKCDTLSVTSGETEKKYNQLVQDRKEIVEFLKKSLEQRQDEIADLNDRLLGLQQVSRCLRLY